MRGTVPWRLLLLSRRMRSLGLAVEMTTPDGREPEMFMAERSRRTRLGASNQEEGREPPRGFSERESLIIAVMLMFPSASAMS